MAHHVRHATRRQTNRRRHTIQRTIHQRHASRPRTTLPVTGGSTISRISHLLRQHRLRTRRTPTTSHSRPRHHRHGTTTRQHRQPHRSGTQTVRPKHQSQHHQPSPVRVGNHRRHHRNVRPRRHFHPHTLGQSQ